MKQGACNHTEKILYSLKFPQKWIYYGITQPFPTLAEGFGDSWNRSATKFLQTQIYLN